MIGLGDFLMYTAVGGAAQLVDGALGMTYGVTSASMLMGLGMPPVLASASVHYAETLTIGASGLSHLWARNVRRDLFLALVIPGAISVLIGSQLLMHLSTHWVHIALIPYLFVISLILLLRTFNYHTSYRSDVPRITKALGFVAGFVDAIGGGGWSAITVTTLVARGMEPRYVIGSVHLAKGIVSALASISFLLSVGAGKPGVVAGLITGGIVAAPFGALLVRRLPARIATLLAGLAVLAVNVRSVIMLLC